jgi:hypothetical protein
MKKSCRNCKMLHKVLKANGIMTALLNEMVKQAMVPPFEVAGGDEGGDGGSGMITPLHFGMGHHDGDAGRHYRWRIFGIVIMTMTKMNHPEKGRGNPLKRWWFIAGAGSALS